MRLTALLVLILVLFNGCSEDFGIVVPKLHPTYVRINELSDCNVTYEVLKDGNVTLSLKDGKCIADKLENCLKDRKKLEIANNSNIAQILLLNTLNRKDKQ